MSCIKTDIRLVGISPLANENWCCKVKSVVKGGVLIKGSFTLPGPGSGKVFKWGKKHFPSWKIREFQYFCWESGKVREFWSGSGEPNFVLYFSAYFCNTLSVGTKISSLRSDFHAIESTCQICVMRSGKVRENGCEKSGNRADRWQPWHSYKSGMEIIDCPPVRDRQKQWWTGKYFGTFSKERLMYWLFTLIHLWYSQGHAKNVAGRVNI